MYIWNCAHIIAVNTFIFTHTPREFQVLFSFTLNGVVDIQMVAGNMKIISLTHVASSKSKLQINSNSNILMITPNLKTNTNIAQQTSINSASVSPKMKYYSGNSYNNSDSVKLLQTPKQYGSNQNCKKSNSHMLYNIPTTSVLSRKKYYHQHHRHNQQQHIFLSSSKDAEKNIALQSHNAIGSDTAKPRDALVSRVQNQKIPKVGNILMNVEDFVNNNTATLDVNTNCKPTTIDINCTDHIVDNSSALSSHRAESELEKTAPHTSTKTIAPSLLASDPAYVGQHNCVGENTNINLDCNSCWANLVTPQCAESQTLLSWPWAQVSRCKSISVCSTSPCSSAASSSITAPTESHSNLLENTNVNCVNNTVSPLSTKKQILRKDNNNNTRETSTGNRCSSPRLKRQHQRRTNGSTATDDSQGGKYSSLTSANEVSLIIENPKIVNFAADPTAKNTAMTSTALASNTISATATTTATVDSTVKTIATENENSSAKCTSNAVTLIASSPSSTSTNEINCIGELTESSVFPGATSISAVTSSAAGDGSSFTGASTTSSSSLTISKPGSSSSNSYSLDFLHSVGVQMTGVVNVSTVCKSSTSNVRTNTTFNGQNPVVMSPMHNPYCYQNGLPQKSHTMHGRYASGSGGGGINTNSSTTGGHTRDQRGQRFQHHHHYPQQLTIASFMQKELLNENFVGDSNSRGRNNGNNSVNGSGDSGSVDGNNNSGSYRSYQRHSYFPAHRQQAPQQRFPAVQHVYPTGQTSYRSDLETDGVSRVTRSGSNKHSQHSKQYVYHRQQNNEDVTPNSYQSHPIHNHSVHEEANSTEQSGGSDNLSCSSENIAPTNTTLSNMRGSKQLPQKLLTSKKSNFISKATSSCSSSSSSTSSNSSQPSATSYRQQKVKPTTQMNLAIETLPRKINTSSHRINHRLQQFNYHNQQHHSQQYSSAVGVAQSSATQQPHQNIYNLTYVNTEGPTPFPNVGINTTPPSRSCSPSLPPLPPGTPGPHPQEVSASMMLSYVPSHFHSQQHQQKFVHGKCLLTPVAMKISSARTSSSQSASPITVENVVCFAQPNDSGTSCDSVQPTISVPVSLNHDYEDSDSSSTNSVAFSQRQENHEQVKSVSLSSSSSASSTSSLTARTNDGPHQGVVVLEVPHLHSPDTTTFVYNPTFASTSQHYSPQSQPLSSGQQQQSPFHRNGLISMFNVPLNNSYTDVELCSIKQQVSHNQKVHNQQRHFYFASGEHLNATQLAAHAGNGGYWSPLQHSNFLYPPPANFIQSASGPTPTATLSPCLSDQDDSNHNRHFHHIHNQQHVNIANQIETLPSSSHLKHSSTPQMGGGTIIPQQPHQHHRHPQSTALQGGMVTTGSSGAALRQRSGGRNQQQGPQHHQVAAPPPSSSIAHAYPQHNLLYGGPHTHLRSSANSTLEFFAHTPPDRFLARAHLIEAKEAPNTLLNNSKWDTLSQGVWNKFINSQQTEETYKQKMRLWRYLYIIIKNTYPRFGLYLVGSTISGFGADTSDVDMCLVSRSTSNVEPRMEALFNLTVLQDYLSKSAEFENFNLIEAKVPILRFRDRVHQLEVDLNFNNCVGIKNTHLLYCYSQLDWRLRPMVLVTKLWAQFHNINNAKNMTISSYSLVLMVIHFLQYAVSPAVLPCLHELFPDKFGLLRSNDFGNVDMNEIIAPYDSKNPQTIGELFLYFLEYYSCFDYTQFAISIRTGGLLPINVCRLAKSAKNDIHQWKELCIEEPFDLTNTARSVYDFETFERVKAVFVTSWRILQQTLDLNSIFVPIIIPTTNRVASTLSHIDVLYEGSNGITTSEISIRENTAYATTNGSAVLLDQDSSLTVYPLSKDTNKLMEEMSRNSTNGDRKPGGVLLKEQVS